MEVAAAVAAHNFELAVEGLDDVGGGQRPADDVRVVEESQVMISLFTDLANEAGRVGLEALAEVLERDGGDLGIPSRLQRPNTLVEFRRIGFSEVALGVALQVNDTELDVGLGEQAFGDGEQAGEVVVDYQQEAPQAAFDQTAEDVFPLLEVLASEAEEAGQETLLAVAAETDDQIDAPGAEAIALADLDELGVEEEGEPIRVQRATVLQFQFFDEVVGDIFPLLFGSGQSHFVQSGLGGVEGAAGGQQVESQGLSLLGVIARVGRRQEAGSEGSVAGAGHVNLQRDGAHLQGARGGAVAFIGGCARQKSLSFGLAEAVEDERQQFAQAERAETGSQRLGELGGQGFGR